MPYKAFAGLVKPYKSLGRSVKLGQSNFEKQRYDEAHGKPYKDLWVPYKALGVLIRPLGSL